MIKIGGVVVLYNPTKKNILEIIRYSIFFDILVIVDNSLNENYNEFKKKENIKYISFKKNKGIGSALNSGIAECMKFDCQWVMTLDQDSIFENDIVSVYKNYISRNNTDNLIALVPNLLTHRTNPQKKSIQFDTKDNYTNVRICIQSGMLINISNHMRLIADYCGFIEEYFIDYIDFEYCLRALKKFQIIRCNKAILKHNYEVKSCDTDDSFFSEIHVPFTNIVFNYAYPNDIRTYYCFRNGLDVFKKYKAMFIIKRGVLRLLKIILFEKRKKIKVILILKAIKDCRNEQFGEYINE